MVDNDKLIELLKHSGNEELRTYVSEQKKKEYSSDFPAFMDEMLKNYHLSRKKIADRSGLSQDYLYKLLRGDKKTTERDYILAICIAMGMNIAEVQHALTIYGMPVLDKRDLRSQVIYLAITENKSIVETNQWLENAKLLYLKTSPEMPSAEIHIIDEKPVAEERISYSIDADKFFVKSKQIEAEKIGLDPVLYKYWGILEIENEENECYYLEAAYHEEGENLVVLDKKNYDLSIKVMTEQALEEERFFMLHPEFVGNYDIFLERNVELLNEYDRIQGMISEVIPLEQYDSLEEAASSSFFRFFLELDRATDEKVIETLKYVNDTRNFGKRIGIRLAPNAEVFMEYFNDAFPARRQYYQIRYSNGSYTFSETHESCYMKYELDQTMYEVYYGSYREPEYLYEVNDADAAMKQNPESKFVFSEMQLSIQNLIQQKGLGDFFTEDISADTDENRLEVLSQRASVMFNQGTPEDCMKILEELAQEIDKQEKQGRKLLSARALLYYKYAMTLFKEGNSNEAYEYLNSLYKMKARLTKAGEMDACRDCISRAMVILAQRKQETGDARGLRALSKEIIDLLDGHCSDTDEWITLYQAIMKYVLCIEEKTPEKALQYYRKVMQIIRDQQMETLEDMRVSVFTAYNNYAWLLWNKLGSDEAIVYYNQAIDLMESCLRKMDIDEAQARGNLKHVGSALLKIYTATGRLREKQWLIERMTEAGIDF